MTLKGILSAAAMVVPSAMRARVKAELLEMARGGPEDSRSSMQIQRFGNLEVAYRAGTADENVLKESFDNDIFFAGVPEYQPRDMDVILDIGAHIGTFSMLAASKVPRGTVYAIEACQDTYNFLQVNKALNGLNNLSISHLGLADKRGTATLYYDRGNWGHSMVSQLSRRSEQVQTCSLPQFLEDKGIRRIDFVKSNCEGAEFPIFLNTPVPVLKRIHTALILYHCDLWKNNSVEQLMEHLKQAGFQNDIRNRTEQRGWIVSVNQNWEGS